jgi:hypothetical protein
MGDNTKSILWKIYFFIILLNATINYLWLGYTRFLEIADLIFFLIAALGLFAYIWKKTIFLKLAWKIYFFVQILWNIFYFYLLPMPEEIAKSFDLPQYATASIAMVINIPLFIALYLYAFKFNKLPNKKLHTVE